MYTLTVTKYLSTRKPGTDCVVMTYDYCKLIESANAPIFGIDVDGNVNEWNPKTAEITGYSREEVFKKPLLTLIASRNRASVHDVLQQALVGKETISYELEFDTKERRTRCLLLNASTRRDKDNRIIGGKFYPYCFLNSK